MGRSNSVALIGAACLFTAALAGTAGAQQAAPPPNDKPFEEQWWPSEFGPDDKAGAINRITPEYVLKVITLVKQGKTATLGKYYDRDIPAFGARIWDMVLPGTPSGGPFGSNGLVFHDEFVTTEIGQIGTQFDGPGHIGVRTSKGDIFYNGREREATYQRGAGNRPIGMGDLGVEHVAEKAYRLPRRAPRRAEVPGREPAADPAGHQEPRHHHRGRRQGDARRRRTSPSSGPATACSSTRATATCGRTAPGSR